MAGPRLTDAARSPVRKPVQERSPLGPSTREGQRLLMRGWDEGTAYVIEQLLDGVELAEIQRAIMVIKSARG